MTHSIIPFIHNIIEIFKRIISHEFFECTPLRCIEITRCSSIIPEERQQTPRLLCSRAYYYFSPPTGCGGYFHCHGCPVEEAEDFYYSYVLIPVREVPIAYIQSHESHECKMVKNQSTIILNKLSFVYFTRLQFLLAICANKNAIPKF